MSKFIIAQIIGFCALSLSVAVFQFNHRRTMLKLQIAAAILYTIHFAMIGASTGAAVNFIGIGRDYGFLKFRHHKSAKWLPYAFVVLFALGAIVAWQGWISLLPLIGASAGCLAFWQKQPKYIRRFALIAPPLWFMYNIVSHSYAGMIIEVINIVSTFIGIYRFDITRRYLAPKSSD